MFKGSGKQDSMDMIKRPDAAELSATGRFYLQVGYNEFLTLDNQHGVELHMFRQKKLNQRRRQRPDNR